MYIAARTMIVIGLILCANAAFGADSIQGWMWSEGVTGRPQVTAHQWDREIVYVMPVGRAGSGGGMRMLAMEPGWFLIQPPGGFPPGDYVMFSVNMANIDGGSVGFDYTPVFQVPTGVGRLENLQFPTHAHYSVMYNRNYTEWVPEPWLWGSDFYQTFVATSTSVTRIATRLADKSAGPGTHHLSMTLNFAIYEVGDGSPSSWARISPVRSRFLPGTMDPIIHILDVNYLSNEVTLVYGQRYAARFWVQPGSQATSFAIVARPDNNNGYAQGQAYNGNTPQNWDLYGYITGGAPGTVTNFGPIDQESPMSNTLLGWRNKHGQTFRASGDSLAAVEILYTVGCDPNPSIPITISCYDSFGGTRIGPAKTCWSVTDLCQGRAAAFWEKGAVPLVYGNTYYIEFNATSSGGMNVWSLANNIPNAGGYVGDTPIGDTDLSVSISEYQDFDTPTPDPNATATPTPTQTLSPTPSFTPIAEPNLLRNGNMEQGPTGTSGQAPDHWTKWTASGSPAFWHNSDCGRTGLGARLIGGNINGTRFDAGWYQLVLGLTPGKRYALAGFCQNHPGRSDAYASWVGYDLTGQTVNPLANSVVYFPAGGPKRWDPTPQRVFTATGTAVTVFLRARNTAVDELFFVDFDDMVLHEYNGPWEPGDNAILRIY